MEPNKLVELLNEERVVLEDLVFKLDTQRHLLAAGNVRWLPRTAAEVADAVVALIAVEEARAAETVAVIAALDLDEGASLADIAGATGAAWAEVLTEIRATLVGLDAEVATLTAVNVELLGRGQATARDHLASLAGAAPATYTADGVSARTVDGARVLDQSA